MKRRWIVTFADMYGGLPMTFEVNADNRDRAIFQATLKLTELSILQGYGTEDTGRHWTVDTEDTCLSDMEVR